jgi:sulfate adenylyltransferase subunit 1 (EFTu-like GTPase family)
VAPDPYARVRGNGAFILIEATSNATVAAGLVLEPETF